VQVVDAYGVSNPVNITINVYFVDKPPVVIPLEFVAAGNTTNFTAVVTLAENQVRIIIIITICS
jgi:hypothetical protein